MWAGTLDGHTTNTGGGYELKDAKVTCRSVGGNYSGAPVLVKTDSDREQACLAEAGAEYAIGHPEEAPVEHFLKHIESGTLTSVCQSSRRRHRKRREGASEAGPCRGSLVDAVGDCTCAAGREVCVGPKCEVGVWGSGETAHFWQPGAWVLTRRSQVAGS